MFTEESIEKTITETSWSELYQPSGVYDEELGREQTNLEFIEFFAKQLGAYAVFPNMNGKLSTEASSHNSEVTRTGEGEYLVAVVEKFPVTSIN